MLKRLLQLIMPNKKEKVVVSPVLISDKITKSPEACETIDENNASSKNHVANSEEILPSFMFTMESDKKGNFITVNCVKCYKEVRVTCENETELAMLNEDLNDGVGTGVYILCETRCTKCEKAMQAAEDYFIMRDDAGYQSLQCEEGE